MKRFIILSALLVLSGLSLLLALWWDNHSELILPAPTGPYLLGRTTAVWNDDALDTSAPNPTKRELFAWIWYPAAAQTNPSKGEYLPPAWRAAADAHSHILFRWFLNHDSSQIFAHSATDVAIAPQLNSYPVVVMRGGLAAMITEYTVLAEDLASHGYIVVGFDAPYRTRVVAFPDGRVITRTRENNVEAFATEEAEVVALQLTEAWSADIGFALDKLTELNTAGKFAGRLDMTKVGVLGHSLGGATALQFCHDDSRCKAVIDIDGAPRGRVINEGLKQPTLFLLSDHGDLSKGPEQAIDADVRAIYNSAPPDSRLRLMIRGGNHFFFSDSAISKSRIMMRLLRLVGLFDIEGARQLEITNHYVHSFFDIHLKGEASTVLLAQTPKYAEVEFIE